MTTARAALKLDGRGPVYAQIHRALAGPILDGSWRPGRRLPSEHELASLTGTSRMTVNRALLRLADDGLVVRRRKAGTFVAAQSAQHAVLEITDIAEEVIAAGQTYAFTLLSRRIVRTSRALAETTGLPVGARVLQLTGVHSADGDAAVYEERSIDLGTVPEARAADFTAEPPGPWLLRQVPWSEARHTIYAIGASAGAARHLGIALGAACLVIERNTWQGRAPVTFVRLVYPGDQHRLVGRFRPGGRAGQLRR